MATIEAFRTYRLSIPFERPLRTGNHTYVTLENVLIEIEAEGLVGIGYAFNFAPSQAEAVRLIVQDLAETIVGKKVEDLCVHWQTMWARLNFIGQTGPAVMALSVVDTALWDLFARQNDKPLFRLLGAVRERIELYPTGGFLDDPIEAVVEEALGHQEAGFKRCKVKVGRPDWRVDVNRIASLRKALGDDFGIMVDANQSWKTKEAISAGRAFQDLGVEWLEEPVSVYDIEGTAMVAKSLKLQVAAGESVFNRFGHFALLEAQACDTLMINLMRCGGPSEFIRIRELAAAKHIPVSSHTFTELSAHLMAATPGASVAEYLPGWWEGLFNEESKIESGNLVLSEDPGFGRSFSRDAIKQYGVA